MLQRAAPFWGRFFDLGCPNLLDGGDAESAGGGTGIVGVSGGEDRSDVVDVAVASAASTNAAAAASGDAGRDAGKQQQASIGVYAAFCQERCAAARTGTGSSNALAP